MLRFNFFGIVIFFGLFIYDIIKYKRNMQPFQLLIYKAMLYIYLFMLIDITFFDIPFQSKLLNDLRASGYESEYNFIPFYSIKNIINHNPIENLVKQIGGNLILLIPLGIYVPVAYEKCRKLRCFSILMLSVSLSIEAIQFLLGEIMNYHYRTVDIDDIILNVTGSLIGFIISLLYIKFIRLLEKKNAL